MLICYYFEIRTQRYGFTRSRTRKTIDCIYHQISNHVHCQIYDSINIFHPQFLGISIQPRFILLFSSDKHMSTNNLFFFRHDPPSSISCKLFWTSHPGFPSSDVRLCLSFCLFQHYILILFFELLSTVNLYKQNPLLEQFFFKQPEFRI